MSLDGNITEIYVNDGLWCCKETTEECILELDPWDPYMVHIDIWLFVLGLGLDVSHRAALSSRCLTILNRICRGPQSHDLPLCYKKIILGA